MIEHETISSPGTPDGDLVRGALDGSTTSFNLLVERYFGCAYSVAYSRVAVRETAEDIAQEAFLRAYLHLKNLKEPSRFAAWVCRIIRNIAADWKARGCNRSAIISSISLDDIEDVVAGREADPRARRAAVEETAALTRAMDTLPPELREVVLLHFGEGLAKNRIAELLELHPSTVGRRVEQALKLLRSELEPVLRSGAAPLCAGRAAARRATSVIAATAVMSSGSKSALAAATATHVTFAATTGLAAPTAGLGLGAAAKVSVGVAASLLVIGTAVVVKDRASRSPKSVSVAAVAASQIGHRAKREASRAMDKTPSAALPERITALRQSGNDEDSTASAADRYKALIRTEIASNALHPWAGIYCSTDPYGAKCRLYAAPGTGYVFESESKTDVETIYGSVTEENDRLTVGYDGDTSDTRLLRRDRTFLPVSWGERRYLVSPQMMISFCSAVNRGTEPRSTPFASRFLLREGDEATTVTGLPEVPENFKRYLLAEQALAAVSSLDEVTTWGGDSGKGYYIQTMLTLIGGSDIGLETGLKLYPLEPGYPRQLITIARASETTSIATHICHSSNPTTASVDMVYTTGRGRP